MNLLDLPAETDIDPAMLAQVRALFDQQQITLTQQLSAAGIAGRENFKITVLTHELAYLKRIH